MFYLVVCLELFLAFAVGLGLAIFLIVSQIFKIFRAWYLIGAFLGLFGGFVMLLCLIVVIVLCRKIFSGGYMCLKNVAFFVGVIRLAFCICFFFF
jgi:hypothetical protein